mgnify:CR=1 FL=1
MNELIYSSTCATYGNPEVLPITEKTPTVPINPYGKSKLFAEEAIRDYAFANPEFRAVILRYFNVFGPGQYGDSPYSTAVSAWCNAIKNGLECRSDGDGEQTRDLCYIDNIVSAKWKEVIDEHISNT